MTGTKKAGFTLIEVLVSLGILVFVLLLVASTYGRFVQSERRSIHQQEMQEDMRLVTQLLNREIRTGYGTTYQRDSTKAHLYLRNQNYDCVHYYLDSADQQIYRQEQENNTGPRSDCTGATYSPALIMTDASSTNIDRIEFNVVPATATPDLTNPYLMTQGFVSFYIQASAHENPAPVIFQSTVTSRQIRSY